MIYIPAISLLITFVIIAVAFIWKLSGTQLEKIFSGKNFLLIAAIILFCILAVVHLFNPQDWTADVLKVIVGVLVGASAAFSTSDKKPEGATGASGVGIETSQFGDYAKVAGRDINETIEKMQGNIEHMKSEVSQIRDSVVNQYTSIEKALSSITPVDNQPVDYLINTIYERGVDKMTEGIAKVVNNWQSQGWQFSHLTSDYQGMDGVILVFTRPSESKRSKFVYYHGSNMGRA